MDEGNATSGGVCLGVDGANRTTIAQQRPKEKLRVTLTCWLSMGECEFRRGCWLRRGPIRSQELPQFSVESIYVTKVSRFRNIAMSK